MEMKPLQRAARRRPRTKALPNSGAPNLRPNPAGAVPLWGEEFFTWCFTKFNFTNFPARITYDRVLRQLDEDAKAQPRQTIQPSNLRTAPTKKGMVTK